MKKLSPAEFNSLSESQQNIYALKLLLLRLLSKIVILLFLACCIWFSLWLVTTANTPLRDNILSTVRDVFLVVAVMLLCFAVFYGFKVALKNIKHEAAGKPRPSSAAWKANQGVKPSHSYVNVKFKDNTVKWKVKVAELDWSLTATNPIVEYMKKSL